MNLEPRVSCALHNSLPRAKDKKRQKQLGLDVQAVFSQSLRVQQVAPTSLCKGGKKVNLISGSSKSVSFLGRGEMNGVFIINFVKFIQTRNFFRRGALYPLYRQSKQSSMNSAFLCFTL